MPILPIEQVKDGLRTDPSLYPQNLDFAREAILFTRLTRAALQGASFLDDRILTPQSEGRWVRFDDLAPHMGPVVGTTSLHFIFHAGHVGSTLASRLLDQLGGVLGLREPLPLRVLADAFDELGAADAFISQAQAQALLGWFCQLWSRGYADTEAVIVKATSSAGRLSAHLLRTRPDARAIFMTLQSEPYLATLLAGQNSYIDLRGQARERYRRLARLGAPPASPLHAMSLGEIAALTWLVETLTQRAQAEHSKIIPIDFDAFLAEPAQALQTIAAHFGLKRADAVFADVAKSPVLQRYSKAPDQPYSPALRQEILADSRRRNSEEISRGLTWIELNAKRSAIAASALSA